jgi:hypothetical protein
MHAWCPPAHPPTLHALCQQQQKSSGAVGWTRVALCAWTSLPPKPPATQKQKLDSHKGFLEWSKGFVMLAPPSVTTNEAETLSNAEQCWQREAALTGAPSAPGAN